jgi:hypothetical protein
MHRVKRNHPALKHGAYSATVVLPGESQADFEKLHRDLIAEYAPSGVHEEHIVMKMARLIWRQENRGTLHIAKHARNRYQEILQEKLEKLPAHSFDPLAAYRPVTSEEHRQAVAEAYRAAEDQAQKELGDAYELTKVGEAATFDGLTKELDINERLDAAIARCLKQLLLVRGVKSIAATPAAASPKRAIAPPKAA